MLNLLVETKNEYTTQLINILSPLVFEGINSIYKDAQKVSKENDILKIFQNYLKAIPKWNQSLIERETNRIITSSQSYGWLNDLVRATLKANLIVLMYNPTIKTQVKIDKTYYDNVNINDFIHKVYIECAREIWNNPYLFFHNYQPIEIKRNQRDCINIIKDCIKEALRKLLPVKHILQIYLGEDMETNENNDDFEKAISDVEQRNLNKLVKKDLSNDKIINNDIFKGGNLLEYKETPNTNLELASSKETFDDKSIGSKILNIIEEKNNSSTSSEKISITSNTKISETSNVNSQISHTSHNSNVKSQISHTSQNSNIKKNNDKKGGNIDDKIINILHKDLGSDSDIETSLNYSMEANEKEYKEIFSNSVVKPQKSNNNNDKKKFFNNYLKI